MPTGKKPRNSHPCTFVLSLACLIYQADALAAQTKTGTVPFPSLAGVEFSCARIPARPHPLLFITQQNIHDARKHTAQETYLPASRFLLDEAKKAQTLTPASIDPSWWNDVKDKPWSDTYPVIYQKTCLEPVGIMLPAYYAALNSLISEMDEDDIWRWLTANVYLNKLINESTDLDGEDI